MRPLSTSTVPRLSAETAWTKCPRCHALLYSKRLHRHLHVCPDCNHHLRISARERLRQLLDASSFAECSAMDGSVDVLEFRDAKPYRTRLAEARLRTGLHDAAVYGTGRIGGLPIVVVALDFAFMGGSMGAAVGEMVTRAAELALAERLPVLMISASGGARMQEGCISLMQMAKTGQAVARLHEAGLLCISLVTHPTYGGTTASFALLGDVVIAEPGSAIGFAGPRVIRQTLGEQLPVGFQCAESLREHGTIDLVAPRQGLRNLIGRILRIHHAAPEGELPATQGQPLLRTLASVRRRPAWETVQLARHIGRPATLDYVHTIFDDFQELHGDRVFGDDSSIVGGPARLGGVPVMVIGHQKGHTTRELIERDFGMSHPEGYRKAQRLMRHAAKFAMPVVALVDTPGAHPGVEAEERGQGLAIATCITTMSQLPVPVVTVITGEGGSGGALALAVGDRVLMLENAYYSVISPEGCASILWGSTAQAPAAAAALRITAHDLLELGVIDGVVPEPAEGAHEQPAFTAENVRSAVVASLRELIGTPAAELVECRQARFRAYGAGAQPSVLTGQAAV